MSTKTKKVAQKAPKLVKMICQNCSAMVSVPKDAVCVCGHCHSKMDIHKKWMDKKWGAI
jgi:hypothetical protein